MNTQEKLEAIRAWCVNALENVAAKRTPGKWTVDYAQGIMAADGEPICYICLASASPTPVPDAAYIAACAGAAEAGWKATIAAIDHILSGWLDSASGKEVLTLSILTAWEGLL